MQLAQAQLQRPLNLARHIEAPARGIKSWNLEMIAHIEMGIGHHRAPDESRNRGLTVQRMGPMYDQPGLERYLAGVFWINGREIGIQVRNRRRTATTGGHTRARGRGENLDASHASKRLHKVP